MSEHPKSFPEFYVTTAQACPYLEGRQERKLFTHLTHDKPPGDIDDLLRGGFRRSQSIAYMPYCESCNACVSTRVPVATFDLKRSFRRVMERNTDIVATRVPAQPTAEHYALFRSYIEGRHAEGGMADMSIPDFAVMVEDGLPGTFITEYRVKPVLAPLSDAGEPPKRARGAKRGRLVGVALCDRVSDGISMVYSFYDCDETERSLGTYMILEHIEHARTSVLPYLYLGYWVKGSPKMDYKRRFQPQEQLGAEGWELVAPGDEPADRSANLDAPAFAWLRRLMGT
jgi:leucyl-tRNA---protein transferase